jgi:hypothetical protein
MNMWTGQKMDDLEGKKGCVLKGMKGVEDIGKGD